MSTRKGVKRSRGQGVKGKFFFLSLEPSDPRILEPCFQKGFSIVELIVIMAIFGLLVSMAIPNFLPSRNLSKVKAAIGISDQIRAALYMYSNEYMNKQGTVPFVYPTASSMGNLDAVYSVLSPWMATNVKGQLGGSGYISYQVNAGRDMYTFSVKAGNSENTPVTATRESVTGVYAGEAVPYP